MNFSNSKIEQAYKSLIDEFNSLNQKSDIFKSDILKNLYEELKIIPKTEKPEFGKNINIIKKEFERLIAQSINQEEKLEPIDVTAPFDLNTDLTQQPKLLTADLGSLHPLMTEFKIILDIFNRLGFGARESLELDDDYHMFSSLNFPEGHPARDDTDTFMTIQTDEADKSLIAPAHTSSMQNRVLVDGLKDLTELNKPIAMVIPGRVFRNEDLDARHEHTFYQIEGVYVDQKVTVGNLMATLKTFLETYYQKELDFRTQPFYFPFTEPSFEFSMSCPFCDKKGCHICSMSGYIELLGCGMIHPNVLSMAGIDPEIYSGFAFGVGIDRLVMMKYNIEDVRHFESAKLSFLRQFK